MYLYVYVYISCDKPGQILDENATEMSDIALKYSEIHENSIVRVRNAADVKRLKAYLEDQVPKELAELKVCAACLNPKPCKPCY